MVFRNRQKTVRLADVLHGCAPGRIQSVGYMQVIPLVSDLSDNRFVSPVEDKADVFTTDYGTLGFRNRDDCVMIVLCHAGYVVKHAAHRADKTQLSDGCEMVNAHAARDRHVVSDVDVSAQHRVVGDDDSIAQV